MCQIIIWSIMKPVRVIDLKGQTYDLSFDDKITITAIRQKLLKDYNYNTDRCYFCRSKKILDNESISKEIFTSETQNNPIIIFNSLNYPDKSYPKVDNTFNLIFSRYYESYYDQNKNSSIFQRYNISRDNNGQAILQILDLVERGNISPDEISQFGLPLNPVQSDSRQDIYFSDSDEEEEEEINDNPRPYDIEFPNGNRLIAIDVNNSGDFQPISDFIYADQFQPEIDNNYYEENMFDDNYDEPPMFNFMDDQDAPQPDVEPNNHRNLMQFFGQLIGQAAANHIDGQMPFIQQFHDVENTEDQDQQQYEDIEEEENQNENQQQQDADQDGQNDRPPPPQMNQDQQNPWERPLFGFARNHADQNRQIIESLNLNINLTEVDNQAIERLVQAGYDRTMVIQVYEACDRNEENALNLLVSMG